MKKHALKALKALAKALLPLLVGLILFSLGWHWEAETVATAANGFELYNAAFSAIKTDEKGYLKVGENNEAIRLFVEAALQTTNRDLRARALYNAATLAWMTDVGNYRILVNLYKESLRNKPGFEEASFNLELLYFYAATGKKLPEGNLPGGGRRGRGVRTPGI